MSLPLYLNHHVRIEIVQGLRTRGVNVLTAYEDRRHEANDSTLLERATALGRVLFSQDRDQLVLASAHQPHISAPGALSAVLFMPASWR